MTWFGIKWPEKGWYAENKTNKPSLIAGTVLYFAYEMSPITFFYVSFSAVYIKVKNDKRKKKKPTKNQQSNTKERGNP